MIEFDEELNIQFRAKKTSMKKLWGFTLNGDQQIEYDDVWHIEDFFLLNKIDGPVQIDSNLNVGRYSLRVIFSNPPFNNNGFISQDD